MYYYHIYMERDWGGLAIIPSRKKKINIKYDLCILQNRDINQDQLTMNDSFCISLKLTIFKGELQMRRSLRSFPSSSEDDCTRYKMFLESFLNNGGEQAYTWVGSNVEESLFWNTAWGKITDSWSFELIVFVTLSRFFEFFPSCVSSKISN